MHIGTMSILFREQLNTDAHIGYVTSLEKIAASGFKRADLNLCQICAHKTTLHTDDWQRETEKIAEAAQRLGLTLSQCHLPFKSVKVKWRLPEEYAYYIEMFRRAIDVASMSGIPWGVIHPELNAEHTQWSKDDHIAANHREFDALIEHALRKNISIAYENMRDPKGENCFACRAEDLCALVDSYRDDRIGICWDTGHAHSTYRCSQWDALHVVGKRLRCTHINDNLGEEQDLHLLPWEGTIDWADVIGALRDIEYEGDLILEPSINFHSPDMLKDENGRNAFAVARRLLEVP